MHFAAAAAVCALIGYPADAADGDPARQGGAALAAGRPADAEATVRSCGDSRCRLVLARALFAQGKPREAAAAIESAGELGPLAPYARILQGQALLLSGSASAAVAPLRVAASSEGPVSLRASALLADALLVLGDLAGAREAAERAGSMAGQSVDVQAAMAWVAAQALAGEPGREQQAAEALRAFWLRHPDHPAAETARSMQEGIAVALPEPTGRELLLRASRLLASGKPAAAVAQAQVAAGMLSGEDRAEGLLLHAPGLAADRKRGEARPCLEPASKHGSKRIA